jgi:peptidyl-prolyl cis-trans isomerase C
MSALVVFASPATAQLLGPKPAAVINGETISWADVEAVLKLQPAQATKPSELQLRRMRREALEMLMDDALLRQFLQKHGPTVSPAEVAKQFAELQAGLKAQNRNLADFYKETGQTEEQLRADIHKMLQWAGYVKSHVTETDLKRYFDEYREFFDQVTVRASHILLRVTPGAAEADRQQARARLESLRQDIINGKIDFAEAAKKYSQCVSAPQGGDIGYIPRKWAIDENLAKIAFALKVGEVSDVVQTEFGFHLIKVVDRKAGQPANFDKIKDGVREAYVDDLRQAIMDQQRKTAQIQINAP